MNEFVHIDTRTTAQLVQEITSRNGQILDSIWNLAQAQTGVGGNQKRRQRRAWNSYNGEINF